MGVETGATMEAAGLEVVSNVLETEALLFQQVPTNSNGLNGKKGETVSAILARIRGYLTSTKYIMMTYNCRKEDLATCCNITPSRRFPQVTNLTEEGWHAVTSLAEKDKMNVVMDQLVRNGAQDVLCFDVTNTRV